MYQAVTFLHVTFYDISGIYHGRKSEFFSQKRINNSDVVCVYDTIFCDKVKELTNGAIDMEKLARLPV